MPTIAESNDGIDICGERLKIRLKTLFTFCFLFAKLDQKSYSWTEIKPGNPACKVCSNCKALFP